MDCQICGKYSGHYQLCDTHFRMVDDDLVDKCEHCEVWYLVNEGCPTCDTEVPYSNILSLIAGLCMILGLKEPIAKKLIIAGYEHIGILAEVDKEELADTITGLSHLEAERIIKRAKRTLRILHPDSIQKLTRMQRPGVGTCPHCSGTLVEEWGIEVCRACGKVQRTKRSASDDWEESSSKLRRELRKPRN